MPACSLSPGARAAREFFHQCYATEGRQVTSHSEILQLCPPGVSKKKKEIFFCELKARGKEEGGRVRDAHHGSDPSPPVTRLQSALKTLPPL